MEAYSLVISGCPILMFSSLTHSLVCNAITWNFGHGDWWFPRAADNATFHNSTQIPIPNTLHFGKDRIQPYLTQNQQLDAPLNEINR
jgi:hypothetical protein